MVEFFLILSTEILGTKSIRSEIKLCVYNKFNKFNKFNKVSECISYV